MLPVIRCHRQDGRARKKFRNGGGRSEPMVPWAGIVATVATIEAVAHQAARAIGQRATVLNGEIRQAAAGIKFAITQKSMGRTGIQATAASATTAGHGPVVGISLMHQHQLAEEEIAARTGNDELAVAPLPA